MRTWAGFASNGHVGWHVTRQLGERDQRLFAAMAPGEEYPEAVERARQMFLAAHPAASTDPAVFEQQYRDYVPPYDPGKFPNKWWKICADRPVRTLTAHLGRDTYSHIHYDDDQARVISVREAARLQSFPDGFQFHGSMNSAYRQIGNAVPPLMAWHIAQALAHTLGLAERSE